MGSDKSFNDRLVSKTVLPVIYLWMLAAGAVVFMGIQDPDTVLANLDGFIALIAIIGGVAAPALNTLLRMWEAEQTNEVAEIPADYRHARQEGSRQHTHRMIVEKHSVGINVENECLEKCLEEE